MDVTPTTPQTRPTRGKSGAAKTTAAPPKTTAKPARSRKAAAEQPETTDLPTISTTTAEDLGVDLNERIATTAYYLAAARNFEPGHELEDWLEAERQVHTSA